MKLYFLVEGVSSEMKAYPEWIKYYLPSIQFCQNLSEFKDTKFGSYFISGEGYPSIFNHIQNSIEDIINDGSVDYFFIILDADEDESQKRIELVKNAIDSVSVKIPERLSIVTLVQSRCFETVLLGNRNILPRFPKTEPLISYYQYYNVVENDPALMGNYSSDFTHSQFHFKYAIHALRERRINYSKSNCSSISNPDYFEKICQRYEERDHLKCLTPLIETLKEIADKMNRA